jgi:hypothetical protein
MNLQTAISQLSKKVVGKEMKCANKTNAIADQLELIQQMGDILLEEADIKMDEMQALYIIRDSERKKKKQKLRKSNRKLK